MTNFRKVSLSSFVDFSPYEKPCNFNDALICKFQMLGIIMAAPERQFKLQVCSFFLSRRMTLKSLGFRCLRFCL